MLATSKKIEESHGKDRLCMICFGLKKGTSTEYDGATENVPSSNLAESLSLTQASHEEALYSCTS